jgi:tetratricopeptide (TPR) repeat protein
MRLAICALGVLVWAAGCGGTDGPPNTPAGSGPAGTTPVSTPDGRALRPVTLPDLSQMAESAQTQIRDRYSALQRINDDRRASTVDRSGAYGDLGKLLMAAQVNDGAEASFLDAQLLDSSDYRWPYYLGHLYRTQGQLEQARAMFERALELRPNDMAALVWTGDVYLASGLPDAAAPLFSKALSIDPQSISARYGLGRTALARNDPRAAAAYLEEVLRLNPNAGDAHYPLSLAYTALGDSAKAGEHLRLRRSQKIQPADPLMAEIDELLESPQTYETLGIRSLAREDWPAAEAAFRKGLELAPTSPALRFRLATTMNMMGDAVGAEALFEQVVRDAPDYFPAQFSLGVVLQAKGSHSEAVQRFTAALKERSDYAEARLRLASSLRRLGRTKEALSNYEQVARANPALTEAHVGFAMMLAQLGRFQEARDYLAEQATAHPDQTIFTLALARLLAAAPDDRVRDSGRAMTLVQAMLAKGRTVELGETMAMTLAAQGHYDEAAGVQRDLIRTVERVGPPAITPRLIRNLQLYQRQQRCATPWTSEEMP